MNAVVVYRITKGLPTTCLWLRNPVFWEMMLLNCLWYNTCDGVLEWLIWIPMFDLSIDLKHVLFLVSTPVDTLFGNPLYSLGTLEISVLVWVHIFICRWDLSYFRAEHSHSIFLFFFASKVIEQWSKRSDTVTWNVLVILFYLLWCPIYILTMSFQNP